MAQAAHFSDDFTIAPETKIGIAIAEFNKNYTQRMLDEIIEYFEQEEVVVQKILWVPGAFELPLGAQKLLDEGCNGVLTLGVVIRGDTSHYDYVCDAAAQGILRVSLDNKKPVIFGVLTCENERQVEERITRSRDLAISLLKMLG